MKEQLVALWAKASNAVVENKEVLIKVGGILIGATVGALVATAIANAQEDEQLFFEEDSLLIETD